MAHHPGAPAPDLRSRIGILADDMTGAGDTALQFLAPDGEVWVLPGLMARAPSSATVVAINTDSRHLPPAQAVQAVDQAGRMLQAAGCGRFYKKIDSTLRGNVAIELQQALTTLNLELAVVAPAFPQAGRITVGGYQLVDGVPVDVSPYAQDALAPARDSHLPSLLGGDVAYLGLKDVMGGAERVASALIRAVADRKRILVTDAARPEDLAAIARAMALVPYRLLPVGSAGLAKAMQPHHVLDARRTDQARLLGARPPVLVVAGSLNPVTGRQVDLLARHASRVVLDAEGLLLAGAPAVERAVQALRMHLYANRDAVLVTNGGDEGRKARALGRDLALSPLQIAARVAEALGEVVARIAAEAPLAGVVVAGGETATAVCRALGAPALRVMDEPLPAIPLLRAELANGPLRLVTKSGGFGAEDALKALVERLKREDG